MPPATRAAGGWRVRFTLALEGAPEELHPCQLVEPASVISLHFESVASSLGPAHSSLVKKGHVRMSHNLPAQKVEKATYSPSRGCFVIEFPEGATNTEQAPEGAGKDGGRRRHPGELSGKDHPLSLGAPCPHLPVSHLPVPDWGSGSRITQGQGETKALITVEN